MVEIKDQVEQALNEIRPFLVNDGGNISLVAIEGDTVIVELEGNCISCSVQKSFKNWVPTIMVFGVFLNPTTARNPSDSMFCMLSVL